MVLNGAQAHDAVLGKGGLLDGMDAGKTVIVSATILPAEVRALEAPLAAKADVLEANRDVLDAISKAVFHVGEEIGQGQTVKAALQAMIGCTFAATFETLVMGHKAGVKGETLFNVIQSSAVGSPLFENSARLILDRKFKDTGSHIGTMHEAGAAMFATRAAYEMFQVGISRFPTEDNWSIVKWLEEIAGTEVTW